MQTIKVRIENGQVKLPDHFDVRGPADALLIIEGYDPWEAILSEVKPRPAFLSAAEKALDNYKKGKTTSLDPENL